MTKVNVTIDGIILHCDNSVKNINIGNGYKIEKRYFFDLPYKDKITDGEGKLTINYLGSQMEDENGIYFMCLHKEDDYEIQLPEIKSNVTLTDNDLICEQQLSEYKQKEMDYLHRVFSLLHLFKKGNIGFSQIFFVYNFTVFGFINYNIKRTDNSISKNVIEDTLFSLSTNEIAECNAFLSNVSTQAFNLFKDNIDEFIWGLEQTDISTGFEQYTTALEMTLLAKGEHCKREILSKRVAVLLESDTQKIQDLYNKMRAFYKYRSDSLHEGNDQNITISELKELEEIVRRVLVKYLEFCKVAIQREPRVTWDTIKRDKISDLKNSVSAVISSGILPT